MIGLATNVLSRLFVRDDHDQTDRAQAFVRESCTPERPGYVNLTVLCEFVWMLERGYRYAREDVAASVEALLSVSDIEVEADQVVRTALDAHAASNAGLVDHLIVAANAQAGCESTATFDRKLANWQGVRTL